MESEKDGWCDHPNDVLASRDKKIWIPIESYSHLYIENGGIS